MRTADAYPFPTLPAPLRFAIAIVAVLVVFAIERSASVVDDGSLFLLLSTAVMATAWLAGTGPALAATVLGGVLGAFDVEEVGPAAPMHLALFVVHGLLLTAVISELRSARRVSERRTMDAEAARREGEAANLMKDEFLATVSHELRTPLNAVLGWVHLLRTGKLDSATAKRGLESIDRNIRLQAQVTSDLLDVSRALTGKLQLDCQPVLLASAAQQALDSVDAAARAKDVQVTASFPDCPTVVLGDATRVRQIAWHLLANAIKFTPRGGAVDLKVEARDEEACLTVADTGSGIDPLFLPRIFDRFTQADPSPTRTAGGLGVGLALVRQLIELQGGRVDAQNRSDGSGAVFSVRFPLQPAGLVGRTSQPAAWTADAACPPLDGVRVLVLDQDAEARDLLQTVLQQRGASVHAVASVADALESLEGWRPDVLVSDSASPEHDVYAVVGKVHELDADRGGRIPALALTSFARTDQRLAPLLAGVHRFLPKPIEPAALTAEVARLSGRERRHAIR